MNGRSAPTVILGMLLATTGSIVAGGDDAYLSWPSRNAEAMGLAMRASGRVGGFFDFRVKNTNKSYNYKLRATWLTPEVIRAAARLQQIRERLSDDETKGLVREAEAVRDTVVLVEIDPREGSGVVPRDWSAFLQAKGSPSVVRGTDDPKLRGLAALRGVAKRDYAYDQFWVVFPLLSREGAPLFDDDAREAEIVVRIHEKEGRASWPIPPSVRERMRSAALPSSKP